MNWNYSETSVCVIRDNMCVNPQMFTNAYCAVYMYIGKVMQYRMQAYSDVYG